MRVVQQDNDYAPDTWKGLKLAAGGRSASYTCPNGHTGVLIDHTILPDGRVEPSLVCPHEGCGFHDFIWLNGWRDGEAAAA